MKQIYLCVFVSILLTSCDYNVTYDYYIMNNCNEEIIINIVDYKNIHSEINVGTNSEQCIYRGITFGTVPIEYFFKQIVVNKNGVNSKVNYVDNNLWTIRRSTKYSLWKVIRNTEFFEESYLTINSKDFEYQESLMNKTKTK